MGAITSLKCGREVTKDTDIRMPLRWEPRVALEGSQIAARYGSGTNES